MSLFESQLKDCPSGPQPSDCAMKPLLELVTGPWTLQILWLLMTNGPMRFGSIRRNVDGISARLLTVRLRSLEQRGLLTRSVAHSNPPQVTYIPTERLQDMKSFLNQLHLLAAKWEKEDEIKTHAGQVVHRAVRELSA